jgi:hypothetical protein
MGRGLFKSKPWFVAGVQKIRHDPQIRPTGGEKVTKRGLGGGGGCPPGPGTPEAVSFHPTQLLERKLKPKPPTATKAR